MSTIRDRSAPRPDELDEMECLLRQPQTIIWLKCKTSSFAVHKTLLLESSKYFHRCLSGPYSESSTNAIDLDDVDPATLGTYVKLSYFARLTAQRIKRRAASDEYSSEGGDLYEVSPFSIKPCDMRTPHDLSELLDLWALTDRLLDDLLRDKVGTAIREALDVGAARLSDPRCAEWWVFNFANGHVALEALPRSGTDDDVQGLLARLRDLFVENCSPAVWKRLAAQLPGDFVVMASIAFQAKLASLVANEAAIARVSQASLCYECKTRVQMALKR
ncbi:kelch-like protein 30 [Colletotrichum plurivorum]|uniref:Kelch-like protein 30 n=1 Tax=Colletotrichum plurivorum TaxID=2175906 RepID=A0A8H6KXN8_9PEZI|nr:kelch-like protein 30 [Colletotrichum plurivorum]